MTQDPRDEIDDELRSHLEQRIRDYVVAAYATPAPPSGLLGIEELSRRTELKTQALSVAGVL